jgi:hypothetical protein
MTQCDNDDFKDHKKNQVMFKRNFLKCIALHKYTLELSKIIEFLILIWLVV